VVYRRPFGTSGHKNSPAARVNGNAAFLTFKFLRRVHRRTVIKPVRSICEYTDDPIEFPDLADKP